jgi:hypothetical protein
MPQIQFQTTIAAPLESVWAFYDNPLTGLPALSPPEDQAQIESADLPVKVGSRITITARGPIGRIRWVARITEHRPPHAVAFGMEARFVDEQESGPFSAWRHEHDFEYIDEEKTRLVDRITYRPPFWPISFLVDLLLVRPKLKRMFRYRHAQTKRLLEETP